MNGVSNGGEKGGKDATRREALLGVGSITEEQRRGDSDDWLHYCFLSACLGVQGQIF